MLDPTFKQSQGSKLDWGLLRAITTMREVTFMSQWRHSQIAAKNGKLEIYPWKTPQVVCVRQFY